MADYDAWVADAFGLDPRQFTAGTQSGDADPSASDGSDEVTDEEAGAPGGKLLDKILGKKEAKPPVAAASQHQDGSAAHPILGTAQQARAAAIVDKLPPKAKKEFAGVLKKAKTPQEKEYITKTLAAGHTVDEIKAFAGKIKGKDAQWMQDNLSLTGNSTGRGVQQQWSHSCNATTVEAVKGELDPIYALKVHEDNPDMGTDADTKGSANLAADQKALLESTYHGSAAKDHTGIAKGRKEKGGRGRWANDMLNNMKDATGLTYETKKVGKDATVDEALTELATDAESGTPVPIVIGNKQGAYTHYVLVTGSDAGPPRTFSIHDPWSGKTVTRTDKQMKDGKIDIAGSNQITAFEKPTAEALP